jgi:DNA-binding SARP family transcriptional activator
MRFSVLGRLQVISDDGTELHLAQAKQRGLLAVLLLHANQAVSASRLTDALWDTGGPPASAGALRTQVWALRKLLAPATRLQTGEHHSYLLEVGAGELDVAEFRRLAEQGQQAFTAGDLPGAVRALTEGLALWSEPPLADVPATLAMAPVTQRLLDERLAARELLSEARLRLGQHASLIPSCGRARRRTPRTSGCGSS